MPSNMTMHVLLISSNYLPQIGGVEVAVDHLAKYLVSQGHRVTLVTSRSGARRFGVERHKGIEIHRIYLGVPGCGWKSTLVFPLLAPTTLIYLRRIAQETQPDLINLHFADNATAYALVLAHWFDLPLVISLHGADMERFRQERRVYRWLLRKAIGSAAAITACSSALLCHTGVDLSTTSKFVESIPNGVDLDLFSDAIPYPHEQPYILVVGRLIPTKGVDLVIRAFAQLPPEFDHVSLFIAGNGPLHHELQRLAINLGLKNRMHFLGSVSHETIPSLIAGCEALVLGSRSEAFGIVLLEAMAAAKPVVATAVGGIPELVAEGRNGLLVPPEDPKALSDAMVRLLADADLRQAMGQEGQRLVQSHYTWNKQGERFLDLYHRVLKR